jgi:DNA-binding HxlR family transcriptional regulator
MPPWVRVAEGDAVTPPQVEHALTDVRREFLEPVRALAEWVMTNAPRMDAARTTYAVRRAAA